MKKLFQTNKIREDTSTKIKKKKINHLDPLKEKTQKTNNLKFKDINSPTFSPRSQH